MKQSRFFVLAIILVGLVGLVGCKKPTITFTANPTTIDEGGYATLTWKVNPAGQKGVTVTASGGWTGKKALKGSEKVGPLAADTEFILTAHWRGMLVARLKVTVKVIPITPPPAPEKNLSLVASNDGFTITRSVGENLEINQLDVDRNQVTSWPMTIPGAKFLAVDRRGGQMVIMYESSDPMLDEAIDIYDANGQMLNGFGLPLASGSHKVFIETVSNAATGCFHGQSGTTIFFNFKDGDNGGVSIKTIDVDATIAVSNEGVYVVSKDAIEKYSINLANILLDVPMNWDSVNSTAFSNFDGILYIAGRKNGQTTLASVNGSDGSTNWSVELEGHTNPSIFLDGVQPYLIYDGGIVLVNDWDGSLGKSADLPPDIIWSGFAGMLYYLQPNETEIESFDLGSLF